MLARQPAALVYAVAAIVGFMLGSIPFGVILARARGIDLKKVGSGNIGATNAARAMGKKSGAVVLLLDTLKAYAPTLAVLLLGGDARQAAATGFAAFAGHIFSPWLRFTGGKGVACGLGAFLALQPAAAGIAALACVIVVLVTRIGSLGSLLGGLTLIPSLIFLHAPRAYLELAIVMMLLILWRHRENLGRIVAGKENKL